MATNFGNTFSKGSQAITTTRVPLWLSVDEMYPGGAYIAPSNTTGQKVGDTIAAGTPISIDKLGGTATIGGSSPIGLVRTDALIGENGCTVGIVTRGQILADRISANVTSAQKNALSGRISFVNE